MLSMYLGVFCYVFKLDLLFIFFSGQFFLGLQSNFRVSQETEKHQKNCYA